MKPTAIKLKCCGLMLGLTALFSSCKEEELTGLSTLNVFNAAVDMPSVKVNTTGKAIDYATYTDAVAFGAVRLYGIPAGTREISGVATAVPAQNLFAFSKDFVPGGLYSLYLVGQVPNLETLYFENDFPAYQDQALAVRIINLSPNSTPLNVTLSSAPTVNEFSAVTYKQQTDFKKYAAGFEASNTAFTFQVRNAAGTLLASYAFTAANLTAARYKSVTLVIRGLMGGTGTNALAVTFVPNY